MSINNDGRSSIMAVSRTSYLTSGTVYKRSVSGVEEKQHAERNVKSGIGELSLIEENQPVTFSLIILRRKFTKLFRMDFRNSVSYRKSVLILLLTLIPRVTPSLITINEI